MASTPPLKTLKGIFDNEDAAVDFLIERGIFMACRNCPSCQKPMVLRSGRLKFRCPVRACRKQISIRKGSFFFGHKLPCSKILFLGYLWLNKVSITSTISVANVSSTTAAAFYKYFRELAGDAVEMEDCIIGGEGVVVEIDEAKLGKRKYNKGHRVEGAWVLGGVERTPERRIFLAEVKDRKSDLLMHVIRKHVKPGSIVHTDLWKGYARLEADGIYQHHTVNHSKCYKDPVTGTHTNTIEGTWNGLKLQIRPRNRTKGAIDEHLWEFIWRRSNKKDLWNAFIGALKEMEYQ